MSENQNPPEDKSNRHPDTVPVDFQYEVALINEECGEVCQIVGKTLRFGWLSYHPDNPSVTNYDLLHNEMGDVQAAIEFGIMRGSFDAKKIQESKNAKLAKLKAVAPPPMHTTRGSTIRATPNNDNMAALGFFALMAFLLVGVALFFYHQGKRSQIVEAPSVAAIAEEQTEQQKLDMFQVCYSSRIAAMEANATEPANLDECAAYLK